MLKLDLRSLILLLAFSSTLLSLANFFYASYQVQRELLVQQTFEANRNYAVKLAGIAEDFLKLAHMQLSYSATQIAENFDDFDQMKAEVDRLKVQTDSFNLTFVVDADGRILANAPRNRATLGTLINTEGSRQALALRKPMISEPYVSASGHLMVAITQPLFDPQGSYLGYVGGAIYLKEENSLNRLLGEHFYRDGSYLYVTNRDGYLLYHKEHKRIGQKIIGNPVIQAVSTGETGSLQLINSQRVEMLAGFAPIKSAGWGVVAQRPLEATLKELNDHELRILINAIPPFLVLMLAIWWLSRTISQPLWELASSVRQPDPQQAAERIRQVRSWYFEVAQLKRAILEGLERFSERIGKLNIDSITDPLTGLLNRRGAQLTLQQWASQARSFAVVVIDIDHFKQVNDGHGHDVGDQTIQFLAEQMRQVSRHDDVLCRNGGEEFMMLLPDVTQEQAAMVAERLRERMADSASPTGSAVTISLGIAHHPLSSAEVDKVLKYADQALYAAKKQGRNRVVLS